MSELKATLGPWSPGHMTRPDHSCGCRYILSEGYMGSIATISELKDGNDSPPESEAIANAHLIAAAPCMFEALKAIQPFLPGVWAHNKKAQPVLVQIDAAIAKAKGETL